MSQKTMIADLAEGCSRQLVHDGDNTLKPSHSGMTTLSCAPDSAAI